MRNVDTLKVIEWLKSQNFNGIEDRIYNIRRKLEAAENYITLKTETLQFNKTEQLDLLTLEIFCIEKEGPNTVEQIADNILNIFPGEDKDFDSFLVYKITPTGKTPTFTLKGQFKVTLFFQVRYLI